jgi:hypothetical protein
MGEAWQLVIKNCRNSSLRRTSVVEGFTHSNSSTWVGCYSACGRVSSSAALFYAFSVNNAFEEFCMRWCPFTCWSSSSWELWHLEESVIWLVCGYWVLWTWSKNWRLLRFILFFANRCNIVILRNFEIGVFNYRCHNTTMNPANKELCTLWAILANKYPCSWSQWDTWCM